MSPPLSPRRVDDDVKVGDDVVARVGDESDATYRFVDGAGETISDVNGVNSADVDESEWMALTTANQIGLTRLCSTGDRGGVPKEPMRASDHCSRR